MRATIFAVWLLALGYLAFGPDVEATAQPAPVVQTIPACEVEDGSSGPVPCRWQADEAGNGIGLSFTITEPNHYLYDDGHEEVVFDDGSVLSFAADGQVEVL